MAELSDEEKGLFEKLKKKMEAPAESVSKALNITVDLGDKAQVALARTMGLLPGGDDDKGGDGSSKDDPDPDDVPKRRSYFPS